MKFKYIVSSIVILIGALSVVLYTSIKEADIDYKYGEFSTIFHQYNNSKSYFVIIDKKETGFLLKYGDALLVENNKCMTHLTDYITNSVEIYEFESAETFQSFSIKEAEELKKMKTTQMVFKYK
ncbi:MAG TPA: hypothetical protein VJL37_10435 [Flavobacterium sp.]|nr:hypothetical protein [Flavobacterium sp.]